MPHREGHRSERIGWFVRRCSGPARRYRVDGEPGSRQWQPQESTRQHVLVAGWQGASRVHSRWLQENTSGSALRDTVGAQISNRSNGTRGRTAGRGGRADRHLFAAGSSTGSRSRGRAELRQRSAGRARARRTRPDRRARCPSAAGRAGVRGVVRHRRGHTGLTILLAPADALVGSVIAVLLATCVSCTARDAARVGGASVTSGRRESHHWGVVGDAPHGRGRQALR